VKRLVFSIFCLVASVAFAQDVNFSNTTPAAQSGGTNVLWQKDALSPVNVSAYVPGGVFALAVHTHLKAAITDLVMPQTLTCGTTDKISAYNAVTGVFTCTADQTTAGGTGITSLNGATVGSQTFATPGTTGTAPSWNTNTGTGAHTLNIPLASASSVTAGLLSKTDYDSFVAKVSMVFPGAGIAVSTGSAWGTSKASPAGTIVGTSDTQALTNKDLTGAGNTFPTLNQNTTGTAANVSGTPALPNGTTATTQTTGDNTAKIATNAFVNASIAASPGGLFTAANNATAVAGNKAVSGTCTTKVNASDEWEDSCPRKSTATGPDKWPAQADPGSCADGDDWYSSTTANRRKFCAGAATPQTYAWSSDITNMVTAGSAAGAANQVALSNGADKALKYATADSTTTHAFFATAGAPAFRAFATTDLPATSNIRSIGCGMGSPTGSALTTSETCYVVSPYACTIAGYNILVDAGTATIKTWRKATGTAIPTVSDSISTSGVAISTGTALHSTTVSDWTSTAVSANDIIAFNLSAVATAKFVYFSLQCNQ
jgi:hypothetical protein